MTSTELEYVKRLIDDSHCEAIRESRCVHAYGERNTLGLPKGPYHSGDINEVLGQILERIETLEARHSE